MRKLHSSAALITSLIVSAPAMARGFDNSISTQVTSPIKVEVVLSEDMAHRANNLPKDFRDRNGARSLNDGFAGNGFYGDRELRELTDYIQSRMANRFEKRGVAISGDAPVVLRVTLEDASPNRPTFTQLGRQPSLSFNSYGIGGAELSAELIGADGSSLGVINYERFDYNIEESRYGGIWSGAKRSIRNFSKKTAKALAN